MTNCYNNMLNGLPNHRMKAIGLRPVYDVAAKNNPLPGHNTGSPPRVSRTPQETEIESYLIGGIKQDVKKDTFTGFKL